MISFIKVGVDHKTKLAQQRLQKKIKHHALIKRNTLMTFQKLSNTGNSKQKSTSKSITINSNVLSTLFAFSVTYNQAIDFQ